MVALTNQKRRGKLSPAWHARFVTMLPAIVLHARIAFRRLRPEARAEAIQEAVCNACCAVARLAELGKLDVCHPTVLARFAVAQVKAGRKVGGRLNCHDVSSDYCRRRKRITVERLDRFDPEENAWAEAVVQDTRSAPVPEIVAFRCDFADWLALLPRRDRRIAEHLALGNRTDDTARKFKVSAGRVSQLRRELADSWRGFVGDPPLSCGTAVATA
jgi:hypothetical protein